MTGHRALAEIENDTRDASQVVMADPAMDLLANAETGTRAVKPV